MTPPIDPALFRKLDSMLIDVHALLLQIEATMGEIRLQEAEIALREAGLQKIGGSMFVGPVELLDGEISDEASRAVAEAADAEGFGRFFLDNYSVPRAMA